ncbi:hypothetical protein KKA95_04435 [Patescibacteria group bacterium]|nr:hypothetical protein [Patescibacteria group bacterium]
MKRGPSQSLDDSQRPAIETVDGFGFVEVAREAVRKIRGTELTREAELELLISAGRNGGGFQLIEAD